ncbi:tape measure protein [Pseudomonas sp.]|uniref:tape measure protein n=1 Tax=Pseudomonas sp. TaxID=306 RepID=UPI0027347290|nr:tape measure protein [Pseudomonas sp.]MDP2746200.1 tape measure protein [Pseudomonas sp.]
MTDVELSITANLDDANREVRGFKKEYVDLVREVTKPLGKVNSFRELGQTLETTQRNMVTARDRVRELANELARSAAPTKELQADYRNAASALQALERQESSQIAQLRRYRAELVSTGVDVGNLAAEQQRLAAQLNTRLDAGRADAALSSAREALGVGAIEETQRELVKLRQQYQLVGQDGSLSAKERAEAEAAYRRSVGETLARLRDMRGAIAQQASQEQLAAAAQAARTTQAREGIRAQTAALGQLAREQRMANLEQAKADFGITRARQFEGALERLRSQYQLLRASGNLTTRELSIAQQAYTRRVIETKTAMGQLQAEQRRLSGGGAMLPGLVSGVGAAYATVSAIKGIAAQADAYNLMNARLKLATSSQQEFTTAQTELGRIAQATQSPVASLVTLYGRISRPLKEAGRSQSDILKVTEAVATSFRVSGATAEEAQNGVIQFAQALGAGALRGEEFNSVAEQAPRLMQALAASIGVPVGALKEMASQGLLTADVVSDALVSQLDVLRKEAETLPETVGGAMTALADQWNKAIGQADVQPLIDAINELSKVVQDPGTTEGLISISGAITRIAAGAVGSAADLGLIGDQIGLWAAQLSGGATELDKINKEIQEIQKVLSGAGLADMFLKLFFSDEELKAKLAQLEKLRAKELEQQSGQNAELQFLADVAAAAAEAGRQKEVDANTKYIGDLKTLQDQQVEDAKKAVKALVAEEKKATAELEKVRNDRLDIDKRYQEALATLGGDGAASYGGAQALKVGARAALQAGDVEGAQAQAQAALKMLQDLAAAGEKTYGFGGFIKELQAIELAANDIEQTNAENKIAAIREQIKSLEADAAKLKDLPLSIKSDEASIEAVRSQIQQLVADMGKQEIVLPVRVVHPDGPIVSDLPTYSGDYVLPPLPQFANGGKLRGPGTGRSDSILMWGSNGEFMQPAASVDYYGEGFMEAVRQRRFPKFADGGRITDRALPAIPAMSPALMQSDNPLADWGRATLDTPGGSYEVLMREDSFSQLLKRTALKHGGTAR